MRLQFDTSQVRAGERAGFWREVVCSVYVPMDAEPLSRHAFHARMDVRAAHGRIFSVVDAGPQRVGRNGHQIAATDGRDILTFMVQQSGTCAVEQAGRHALLAAGDMLMFHNSIPYCLRFDQPFRQTVIQAPRASFGGNVAVVEHRIGEHIAGQSGFGRLLANFVRGLGEGLPHVEDGEASVMVDELFHLLAAQGAIAQARVGAGNRSHHSLIEHAKRYARAMIADPNLEILAIARAQGVSPRTLQRAFAAHGTGVMQWLRAERLALAVAALADTAQRDRSIAQIAFALGFRDLAAFSRSFKSRQGCTPSEWRRRGGAKN